MARDIILCADCEGERGQIERLVDLLETQDIDANFFFVGRTAEQNPDLVRRVAGRFQVDSHTYSHCNLRRLTKEEQRREILKGKQVVEAIIGRPTHGFRAPMHCLNRDTVAILNEEGFIFDLSNLYFYYDMGEVIEIHPSWCREWFPIYGHLGITPHVAMYIFKLLFFLREPLVVPVHPHYTGLGGPHLEAFTDFIKFARARGGRFVFIRDWLKARGIAYDPAAPIQPRICITPDRPFIDTSK